MGKDSSKVKFWKGQTLYLHPGPSALSAWCLSFQQTFSFVSKNKKNKKNRILSS
jgi:hypothetical protein